MRGYIFIIISLLSQITYTQTLAEKIDALIQKQLPQATVAILVKDLGTGQVLYSKNSNKLLAPASSVKLFTAAASLYQLKPNYQFSTTLFQKGQDYFIAFSGSPSFSEGNLKELLRALKNKGGSVIQGNIVLDSSRFKPPFYQGGVSMDDLGWYYSAPDTAAILNGNEVAYEFISAEKQGELIKINPKKPSKALTLINQVRTVSKEEAKDHCNLNIEMKANNTLRLYGCMAKLKDARMMRLAIPDPILWVRQSIEGMLSQEQVLLKGQIINGKVPKQAEVIHTHHSGNLVKLITHMLRESDNLYANSLTKALAYSLTGEGTNKQGAFAIKQVLGQKTSLNFSQIEIVDGIGTRYNLVTAKQLVVLLTDLYHDTAMQAIMLNALPQAGVSGTLKDRMKNTVLDKKVYAKTGTMHDISSLSGYIISAESRPLVFSIIINGVHKPIAIAKTLEEQLLLAILSNSD